MTGRWDPRPMIVAHGTNNRGTAAFRVPYREDANGDGAIECMQVQRRGPPGIAATITATVLCRQVSMDRV